jgi:O-succinylbenzoic acid--CoA ligase
VWVHDLVAVTLTGPAFVETLERVWERGDAIMPVDPLLASAARQQLVSAMGAASLVDERGEEHRLSTGRPMDEGDALVMATSGSTGEPKGVVHTHESIEASARATSIGLEVDPANDRWLCCLPLAHVAGLSVVTRARWAGVPLRILPAFDARAVDDATSSWGATLTTVVPTALPRFDASRFRRIVVGGSAPPERLPANCVVSYGLTETGSAVSYDGLALRGAEIRIVDGEIQVRGAMLFRAYRDGTDPKDAAGWFPTRDAGEWHADGRLLVHGRVDDLIISGGENIWPIAVERVLLDHPGVEEVTVIGRDDPEWGQRVVAVVVPSKRSDPPTLDMLRSHVKARLHPYAAPRELDLVDALPRTPLGKVRRRNLG